MNRKPLVGVWYHNLTGKVFRVWSICYRNGIQWRIVLENEHKFKGAITINDWNALDLETEAEVRRRNMKQ